MSLSPLPGLLLLLAACACLVAAAPLLYDPKTITQLTSDTFRSTVGAEHSATLVNFCTLRNGKCKELAPQYTTLAKTINPAYIQSTWVDCKENSALCDEHKATDNLPLIKLFTPSSKVKEHTYKGKELKVKELAEWVWSVFPNHVQVLTADGEKKKPRDKSKARVLLFTEKRESSPLYKSLALSLRAYADRVVVAEVRKSEKKLLNHYGIGKTFPVLLVEPPVQAGEEERSARRYDGNMDKAAIMAFVLSFVPGAEAAAAAGGAAASAAGAAASAVSIPELVDQSCVEKHCGGPLCMVMFLSKDHPDLQKHLATLAVIDKAAHADKQAGAVRFVWADSAADPKHAEWAARNFDLQAQDYPQLLLLSVRKARMASFVGAFAPDSVVDFLRDVAKGKQKTVPFATRDGKLEPLPTDTQACPPDAPKQEAPKAGAGKGAPNPAAEEGELVVLTDATHDEALLQSVRPWVLFFHAGDAHAATHANLTADFTRVAKNMKDMVLFGRIDIDAQPQTAARYGVTKEQVPLIKSLAHGVAAKADPSSAGVYPGEAWDAKSIRAWSQQLLQPAKVLVVTGQGGMQQFMGDLKPNEPFGPKLILFAKPGADGSVVVPDMIKALALEFGGEGQIVFGVASSREKEIARQFQVTKIPAVYVMGQQADVPGSAGQNQIAVAASQFGGNLVYSELHLFCEQTLRNYQTQKIQWLMRAAQQQQQTKAKGGDSKAKGGKKRAAQPPPDEEDSVDLDKDEL